MCGGWAASPECTLLLKEVNTRHRAGILPLPFLSVPEFSRGPHARDHFVSRPHGVGEKSIVDHRLIAVAPNWMPGSSGCVLDNCDLEALFQQLAQMGFDAHVRQHAAGDHLTDAALAQLENEVVGLRAAVRRCLR